MAETGYGRDAAMELADELSTMDPALQKELVQWWNKGDIDLDREVAGWSLRKIAKRRARHVCCAFTFMNGLLSDPEETKKLLTMYVSGFRPRMSGKK